MPKFVLFSLIFLCFKDCIAQPGRLDPTFGNQGIAKTDMGLPFDYSSAGRQVLIQPGGSIYILFNNPTFISKRLPDGSIDSSYGIGGYSKPVSFNDAYAALQPDGKIVIVGGGFDIQRLDTNGLPDGSFENNGAQAPGFYGNSYASSVVIQNDGKIVVAGTNVNSDESYFAVSRYNPDGSPDNTFNGSGRLITDFGFKLPPHKGERDSIKVSQPSFAKTIAIQADSKIVVGGSVFINGSENFAITRYNTDASLDSTFGNNGKQTTSFGSYDIGNSLAIDNNGKIVLGGYTSFGPNIYLAIVRYNYNGTPDSSFNGNGKQTAGLGSDTQIDNTVAIQADNKIVVAGTVPGGPGNHDFALVRFNTDGSFDQTFGGNGILTTDFTFSDDYASSVAIQSDNKIVAAGYSYIYAAGHTVQHLAVSRYTVDGNLDDSFADHGKLEGGSKQGDTRFNTHTLQADGKIVAAGVTWNGTDYDFAVTRYNTNGKPDSTFSEDGVQTTEFGGTDEATSIAIQSDKKIVVVGNSDNRFAIARYNADGSPDNTFGTGGKFVTSIGFADACQSVALQSDGKIVVAGYSFTDAGFDSAFFAIARFNTNGSPDVTFNGNGKQLTDFGSYSNFASSMMLQNDGKIVVAGRSYLNDQDNFSIARYNIDGSPDTSFSHDGKQNNVFGPDDYFAQSLAIQNDGKIIVVGFEQSFSGSTSYAVARYKTNGELDNTFGIDGFQSTSLGASFNFGKCIAVSSSGQIAVGGTNDNYAMVLYKNDGSLDSSFGADGIQITSIGVGGSSIQSLSFANDKLYAAGYGQFPGDLGVIARYLLPEGGTLPVSLLDFKASLKNKAVLLQWKIATEKDLAKFVIERSADGNGFLPINMVAANREGINSRDYSVIDQQPLRGVNFYRLKMIDTDAKFTYSNTVAIKISEESKLRIFPNPVQRSLFVQTYGNNENAIVQVFDGNGRKLKEVKIFLAGETSFSIDISNLPSGFYNLIIHKNEKAEVKTFIKR